MHQFVITIKVKKEDKRGERRYRRAEDDVVVVCMIGTYLCWGERPQETIEKNRRIAELFHLHISFLLSIWTTHSCSLFINFDILVPVTKIIKKSLLK